MQVEDALELGEEGLEEEAEYARPRKVLRRGGAGWARPAVTADDVSCLLAGAPALVDQLLEECSIRSVTLVARDAVNLSLAAGGKVELSPVWAALAQRLRCAGGGGRGAPLPSCQRPRGCVAAWSLALALVGAHISCVPLCSPTPQEKSGSQGGSRLASCGGRRSWLATRGFRQQRGNRHAPAGQEAVQRPEARQAAAKAAH